MLVQKELEQHASSRASSLRAASSTRRRSPIASAFRAVPSARRSARSRNRASSASRRTAAYSSARSRRGSRRDLRAARRARRIRRPPARAGASRRSRYASCARASSGWRRAAAKGDVDAYLAANRRISTTGWSSSPATRSSSSPTGGSSTSCTSSAARRSRRAACCRSPPREHRDIVDKIAAGQPVAAGRALYDHVMASRERMHRSRRRRARPARARQPRRGNPVEPADPHRQSAARIAGAAAAARRRLRRRLRARIHQPGDRHGTRAVPRRSARARAPASPPTASCRRSRIPNNLSIVTGAPPSVHGICGNYFWDRDAGAEVMMNDPKYLRARTILADLRRRRREGRRRHREGQAARAARPQDDRDLLLVGEADGGDASRRTASTAVPALVGMPRAVGLQRRAVRVRVRGAASSLMERVRPDVMYLSTTDYVQHKVAPGVGVANDVLRDDGRLPRRGSMRWARPSSSPRTTE